MENFDFNFNIIKSGAPTVTVNSMGIAFNELSRKLLGYPEAINIGFDEKSMVIGIKAHEKGSDIQNYEFEKKEKNGWVRIGCKDFIRYLTLLSRIDFAKKAKQFIAQYDEEIHMLIVIVDDDHIKK